MDKKKFLIIESTVFIEVNSEVVLFYDSIDGKKVLSKNKEIYEFFKEIDKTTHMYALDDHALNSKSFIELIKSLEKNLMGRIITNLKTPPVQFYPMPKPNVLTDEDKGNNNESDKCLQYLTELSIYSDTFHPSAPSIFSYAYKQTLCHIQDISIKENTNIGSFMDLLLKITELKTLNRLNILGGDLLSILETKKAKDSIAALSQNIEVNIHINYFAFPKIDIIKRIHDEIKSLKFKYCIANHLKTGDIGIIKELCLLDYVDFVCLCENANDVLLYEELFIDSDASFQLIPIYNGKNSDFFSENVFLEFEDIMGVNINQVEVQKNIALNTNKFGKLFILPNATVFSDINSKKLGNLNDVYFTEIVYNEINNGDNWFKTRLKVNPCNTCVFCAICPPISNYEHAFQMYNLCNINMKQLHISKINNYSG